MLPWYGIHIKMACYDRPCKLKSPAKEGDFTADHQGQTKGFNISMISTMKLYPLLFPEEARIKKLQLAPQIF